MLDVWARPAWGHRGPSTAPQRTPPHGRRCAQAQAHQRLCHAAAAAGDGQPVSPQLARVLADIDAANACDPRTVAGEAERQVPYQLQYSQWVTEWTRRLQPAPSDELLIVARGQHIERWKVPRGSYPAGRQGYLKWREDLKKLHAQRVAGIMAAAGYDAASQDKVVRFILKRDLRTDPENQAVEDALCLVFLQHQFAEMLTKKSKEEMAEVVRRTWVNKMGERGRAAALELAASLPPDQLDVVQRALAA